MKYTKYVYALCLLFSLGACGDNGNPLGNSTPPIVQVSGEYDLTQSSRQECEAIFDTHIRVQQNGSQLSIERIDSTSTLTSASETTYNPRSSFTDTPATNASDLASSSIESIQGSIDGQGHLTLSGVLRLEGSTANFSCSGSLSNGVASLACQVTGMPEASCNIRYERRGSHPNNSTPPSPTTPDTTPTPPAPAEPLPSNPSESCDVIYDLGSSSEAECNAMLGSQITLMLADDLRLRSSGEVPQTLQIALNASGELHLQRPSGRFHAEDCQVIFSNDLRQVTFDCAAWERAYDPPSCSVTYNVRGRFDCFLE